MTTPRKRIELKFARLPGSFAICKIPADGPIPAWATTGVLTSVTRTADELSIVCPEENVPGDVQVERAWACFRLAGPFPLSQTGVLSSFIDPLSANGIPIFTISTYNTDYVLIKQEHAEYSLKLLGEAGHVLQASEKS